MFRFSHIAAPAVIGAALFVGVQGCASEHKDMPGNAQLISEGHETVSATAAHDGVVYVYDDTSHKNVYSGRVVKGDNVKLDAQANRVMFNDRIALQKDLPNDHTYQIYFDRNETGDAVPAAQRQSDTVIQSGNGSTTVTQPNGNSTTVIPAAPQQQPSTVIQPPGSSPTPAPHDGTYVKPDGTVIQPNGTTVTPGTNGSTVVTPAAR